MNIEKGKGIQMRKSTTNSSGEMAGTQLRTERTLQQMKRSEQEYHSARQEILKERAGLKDDIQRLLHEGAVGDEI